MNTTTILHQMCHEILSQADISAIGKARGLSSQEVSTPALLENYFLSSLGLDKAMASLSIEEIAFLHLLRYLDAPTNVVLFERLYKSDAATGGYYRGTFTQRYQSVYKQVRARLIRSGVLLIGEARILDSVTMERWRFHFPSEFAPHLPLPFAEIQPIDRPGKTRHDVPRRQLSRLAAGIEGPSSGFPGYDIKIVAGKLKIGEELFQAKLLRRWQQESWRAAIPAGAQRAERSDAPAGAQIPVALAVTHLLGLLPSDCWLDPKQLDPALLIFCDRTLDVDAICRLGWEWGWLSVNGVDGRLYYRLAELDEQEDDLAPAAYLTALGNGRVGIDLEQIPYHALEQINRMAFMSIQEGQLTATPDLIGMGRATEELLTGPLVQWLVGELPGWADTYKTIQQRRGKQILHTNLLIARVQDLGLRVKIERSFKPSELVVLSDDYIAFPPELLPKIKRIVAGEGHVIKNYEA